MTHLLCLGALLSVPLATGCHGATGAVADANDVVLSTPTRAASMSGNGGELPLSPDARIAIADESAPEATVPAENPATLRSDDWTIHWTRERAWALGTDGALLPIYEPGPPAADCYEEFSGRVLSVVGPIVSYSMFHATECRRAAHPSEVSMFCAVDLRKIARHDGDVSASMFEFFDKAEVERMLALDPYLNAFHDSGTPCEYSLAGYDKHWAVYERKTHQVAVRLGLPHGCEVMRGRLTQIGLLLTPMSSFQHDVAAAAASGHLMARLAPNPAGP